MSQERIEILEQKVNELSSVLSSILSVLSKIQSDANDNFTTLEAKIDEFRGHTGNEFKDVKLELKKIQNVTGYEAQYANMPPNHLGEA